MENPFETNTNRPSLGLRTLTVLSIIGSVMGIIGSVWNYFSAEKSLEQMRQMIDSGQVEMLPSFFRSFYSPQALEMAENMAINKLPFMLMGLLCSVLCLAGSLSMRKLQKQGFFLWLAGEWLVVLGQVLMLGVSSIMGFGLIGVFIAALFTVLYVMRFRELS